MFEWHKYLIVCFTSFGVIILRRLENRLLPKSMLVGWLIVRIVMYVNSHKKVGTANVFKFRRFCSSCFLSDHFIIHIFSVSCHKSDTSKDYVTEYPQCKTYCNFHPVQCKPITMMATTVRIIITQSSTHFILAFNEHGFGIPSLSTQPSNRMTGHISM